MIDSFIYRLILRVYHWLRYLCTSLLVLLFMLVQIYKVFEGIPRNGSYKYEIPCYRAQRKAIQYIDYWFWKF